MLSINSGSTNNAIPLTITGSVTSVAVVNQALGSRPSGYEFRTADSLISPYAGVQYYRTWLDGYAELDVGAFNLAFAPQTSSQVVSSAGLRGHHAVPAT